MVALFIEQCIAFVVVDHYDIGAFTDGKTAEFVFSPQRRRVAERRPVERSFGCNASVEIIKMPPQLSHFGHLLRFVQHGERITRGDIGPQSQTHAFLFQSGQRQNATAEKIVRDRAVHDDTLAFADEFSFRVGKMDAMAEQRLRVQASVLIVNFGVTLSLRGKVSGFLQSQTCFR